MGFAKIIPFLRALTQINSDTYQELKRMHASIDEIKQDLADEQVSAKALLVKVQGLEQLTNSIKAQLDTLIAAGAPSVSDLNALRDGLLAAKAATNAAAAEVDATVTADTPAPSTDPATDPQTAAAPASGDPGTLELPAEVQTGPQPTAEPTEPEAPVAPGGPSSTETVVGTPTAQPGQNPNIKHM